MIDRLYGGKSKEELRAIRAAALKFRRIGMIDQLHGHGPYLSVREDISRNVEHLDELGQPRRGSPYQAVAFSHEEDCASVAAAYNALPDLLAHIEELEAGIEARRAHTSRLLKLLKEEGF